MLDDLLKRDDVNNLVNLIKTNERYYKKEGVPNYPLYISDEIALYIFYDALLKYKIVLDDVYLFDEYLEQLEKLYKKLDNFEDIRVGINKLIGRMVAVKLGITNINGEIEKKQIVSFVFNRYILDGYFIHGFNSSYDNEILKKDFIPEDYDNLYEDFIKLNEIFAKYSVINIVMKDFSKRRVYFTDDMIMACCYSNYAPLYYYNLLTNKDYLGKKIKKDKFLVDDFATWTKDLKRLMRDLSFSSEDYNFVNSTLLKQWNLMHKKDKKISLLFVKRAKICDISDISFEDYLNDSDTYEIVDSILSSKNGNVLCENIIKKDDLLVSSMDCFYEKKKVFIEDNVDEYYKYKEEAVGKEFLNAYGNVSIFIILGSLFISLGVIISIFMVLGGM